MNKKYVVRLSDDERGVCQEILKNLKGSSQKQQFPLMTCGSYTTYIGGRLSEHFDHPLLSFEAPGTISTDTIPGGKQVYFAVQA